MNTKYKVKPAIETRKLSEKLEKQIEEGLREVRTQKVMNELEELKLQKDSIEKNRNNRIRILKLFLDRVSEKDLEKNDIPHYIEILCECEYFVKLDEDYHKLDGKYRELIRINNI